MLVDLFISYIKVQRRYSNRTQILYKESIERYLSYVYFDNDKQSAHLFTDKEIIDSLNVIQIRNFIAYLLNRGLNERSVNLHLSALGSFSKFLIKEGYILTNPIANIPRPKEKKRLPHFFEISPLVDYCNLSFDDSFPVMRDRLLVILIYGTGMRRQEVVDLKIGDFDESRRVFRILGKGNKYREIPIVDMLLEKILLYLQCRNKIFSGEITDRFFVTDRGEELYPNFVNKVVKRELTGLKGFDGKKSPHILRHSFATHLLNNGAELNSIKEVLGHSSLAATQVYTHNSFEQLKNIYLTAHPRAKKGG